MIINVIVTGLIMNNTLTFQVEEIRFRKEDSGWSVLRVRDIKNSNKHTVAGIFHQVSPGEVLSSQGKWQNHRIFGKQWISQSCQIEDPTDHTTLITFIHQVIFAEITGLGKRTAEKILDKFGDHTLDIMDSKPQELAQVKGITTKRVDHIHKVWLKHRASKDALLFLSSYGLSVEKSRQILGALSTDDLSELKADPYALIHKVKGVGFKTIDDLARGCGIKDDDPKRVCAAISHLITSRSAQHGHSCIPKIFLVLRLPKFLSLNPQQIDLDEALQTMTKQQILVCATGSWTTLDQAQQKLLAAYQDPTKPVIYCYQPSVYENELDLAHNVAVKTKAPKNNFDSHTFDQWMADYRTETTLVLGEKQRQAVYHSIVEPLFILTGGAGVGKTTTLKAMIWAAERMGLHVGLASPTGRAAQRIKEVTSKAATTLHRLLEWSPSENTFCRHPDNPLAEDLIIVDECSMVDLFLAQALFAALRPNARLVLMGDPHQLPSVGAGAVLKNLIESHTIPTITLTEVFRQAAHSPIISASTSILSGDLPQFCLDSPSSPPSSSSWCHYRYIESIPHIKQAIIETLNTHLSHLDPLQDVQILTPMNKGECGCDDLNRFLQDYFLKNISSKSSSAIKKTSDDPHFMVGDKVIQTVNNYELQVFNGDIGYVIHCMTSKHNQLEGVVVQYGADSNTRAVGYSIKEMADLKLAYAVTIHKSQGSEFPAVIIPIVRHHQHMINRNLIYTALTRSKNYVVVCGDASLWIPALKHHSPPRFTRLTELISDRS